MRRYRVVIDGEPYDAEVRREGDELLVLLEGLEHRVKVEELTRFERTPAGTPITASSSFTAPSVSAGTPPSSAPSASSELSAQAGKGTARAPISGRILEVRKKAGDRVEREETVIILEAMKMESEIRSPSSGVIEEMRASEGDKVNTGEVLFTVS